MSNTGRPRKSATEGAIVNAVAELVIERGYARVTVDEVVARAGTNKPAFYRRFRDLAAVVPHILASRHGTDEDIDTGSLVEDLIEVQRRQLRLFTDPVVTSGFAGWIAEVQAHPTDGESFLAEYLLPRRSFTSVILDRAVQRGEIAPGADPAWIADLLTGPLLIRVMLPGLPPIDVALITNTVNAALDALGYSGDRSCITDEG
ncbi:TetR/AcrR family transcriptional regulator [Leucobacter viscericola]|uniref:TetR/AcrR family transcriptional regulator n=1 Tax=Leucobacter viscericola TaxID=2714935 RepID=A0A6G7XF87_9MICO|nr:TetR/AcrR family transcriptional regulator [Leucobacter viscericola]QIK63225.1 TetR/AcrR family transcriptional regulator [Leucobacter viscericola]